MRAVKLIEKDDLLPFKKTKKQNKAKQNKTKQKNNITTHI